MLVQSPTNNPSELEIQERYGFQELKKILKPPDHDGVTDIKLGFLPKTIIKLGKIYEAVVFKLWTIGSTGL